MSADRVAVVTGASRGAGKGIALALGTTGATVYVTGRTEVEGAAPLPGTVYATAEEISARGGTGIPVVCDHAEDEQTAALFDRVERAHGRLDILVSNAFIVPDELVDPGPFWRKPLAMQRMFDVGLRSSYVSGYYGAPLLTRSPAGLLVHTSAFGGMCYMHGPAYGAVKAGVDKMAHDMAHDLRPHGVAAVSVWMGLLRTERTEAVLAAGNERYGKLAGLAESPEFTGRVIAALADSPDRMAYSGRVLVGAELGEELGVLDVDGKAPVSNRRFLAPPPEYSSVVVD
ncbi:SDR family NAD(P)-dependent oxidoreductase [Sciscionella marina]|uniref:SDR family NAD(P)-dependent oxidoreductase n=1 Tax=Sciscionella marina TaxID=508770 RepID=UPI000476498E|nr:SDR family NAD(P)-dependent oxidoreductase [Sciscionella marina]